VARCHRCLAIAWCVSACVSVGHDREHAVTDEPSSYHFYFIFFEGGGRGGRGGEGKKGVGKKSGGGRIYDIGFREDGRP